MANLVIYRKYRPKVFAEVIGQEHVVQTLTNAIASNSVAHAYLFSGPRGSGKTTLARLLAKAVNCSQRQQPEVGISPEPCNKCSSCQEITQGRAIDLIEIDAASHRGIDEIREIKQGARFVPNKSKYKVFIIDESHQLTSGAANALLKTLEEPPKHVIFILATTEIHKMIPTIISRCQKFDFRKLTLAEIVKRLEIISLAEKAKIEEKALKLIAINSGGSFRDAESILDQVLTFSQGGSKEKITPAFIKELLGLVEIARIAEFVDFLIKKDMPAALNFISQISEKGYDVQEFTKALINYLRQAMITKINPKIFNPIIAGLTEEEFKKLRGQIIKMRETQIREILEIFLEAENRMRYSSLLQLPLEMAVVEILQQDEK